MKLVTSRVLKFAATAGHPLRIGFLLLVEELEKVSPKSASLELESSIGVMAYHVRALLGAGAIVEVEQIRRRGAAEHLYAISDYGRFVLESARFITSPWPESPPAGNDPDTDQTKSAERIDPD